MTKPRRVAGIFFMLFQCRRKVFLFPKNQAMRINFQRVRYRQQAFSCHVGQVVFPAFVFLDQSDINVRLFGKLPLSKPGFNPVICQPCRGGDYRVVFIAVYFAASFKPLPVYNGEGFFFYTIDRGRETGTRRRGTRPLN